MAVREYTNQIGSLSITAIEAVQLFQKAVPTEQFNTIFKNIVKNNLQKTVNIDYKLAGVRRLTVVCYCSGCRTKYLKIYGPAIPLHKGKAAEFQIYSDTPGSCECVIDELSDPNQSNYQQQNPSIIEDSENHQNIQQFQDSIANNSSEIVQNIQQQPEQVYSSGSEKPSKQLKSKKLKLDKNSVTSVVVKENLQPYKSKLRKNIKKKTY